MSSTSGRKNRRRNIMSLPSAQLRIIALFGALGIVYAATNAFISKRALDKLAESALQLPMSASARYDLQIIVYEQSATLDLQLSIFTMLSFCMVCLAGVLISHRLGGPVYHLRQYLDGLASGQVQPRPVHFRRGDFFHDLAAAFNRFQDKQGLISRPPPQTAPDAAPKP